MDELFNLLSSGAKFSRVKSDQVDKLYARKNSNASSTLAHLFEKKSSSIDDCKSFKTRSNNRIIDENDPIERSEFDNDEEINSFRNRLQIRVKGNVIPCPSSTFYDMKISKGIKSIILKNIESSNWKEPTPVQMQAIPILLSGRDILAAAPTGSGKSAAFIIPALSYLSSTTDRKGIRALLLAPTKELADQIHRETVRLSTGKKLKISSLKKSIVSNAISRQDKQLLSGVDMLVSTPLRLLSLLRASLLDLSNVGFIVMDEADKLFEEPSRQRSTLTVDAQADGEDDEDEIGYVNASFLNQVDEIIAACPSNGLQKGLFSATLGPLVQEIATTFLHNPVSVTIGTDNAAADTITQKLTFVGREDGKLLAIRQLVHEGLRPPVLIFMQSVDRAKELFRELVYDGINVDVIHADRTQQQRDEVVARFRRGDIWVLICTDLMARGVDFRGVRMVINYDLPQSPVSYIHRIGRTGRAGMKGEAITLFTEDDIPHLRSIANVMRLSGCEVPDWMLAIKPLNTKKRRMLRSAPPDRRSISTVSTFDKRVSAHKKQIISDSKQKKVRINENVS